MITTPQQHKSHKHSKLHQIAQHYTTFLIIFFCREQVSLYNFFFKSHIQTLLIPIVGLNSNLIINQSEATSSSNKPENNITLHTPVEKNYSFKLYIQNSRNQVLFNPLTISKRESTTAALKNTFSCSPHISTFYSVLS